MPRAQKEAALGTPLANGLFDDQSFVCDCGFFEPSNRCADAIDVTTRSFRIQRVFTRASST
jgi:hypothetical protein